MIHRPTDMTNIESVLEKNTNIYYADRWHPAYVSYYENGLKNGALYGMSKEVRKNIAYSLQYLEYLQLQFEELHLHDVIETLLIKSYIVTAMGIIEAIFHHLVVSSGNQKKESWEIIKGPIHTNVFIENNVKKKYVLTEECELKTPRDSQMDFEYLINKVQEKKLLTINSKAYPRIKGLKRLRNKVHLQIVRHDNDTDYMSITREDYYLVRRILLLILQNKKFDIPNDDYFGFLKLEKEQMDSLADYLRKEEEGNK